MASYDFTGANGAALPSGLTSVEGEFETLENRLAAKGATPSYGAWLASASQTYPIGQPVSLTFNANGDSGGGASGLMVRYTDNQNYFFCGISPSNERLRLFKRVNGSNVTFGTDGDFIIPSFSNAADYTMVAIDDGETIEILLDGVSVISINDTELSNSRGTGIRMGSTTSRVDDFIIPEPLASSISISNPPHANHVYQRNNGVYNFSFPVTYTGTPTALRFRLLNASDDSVILDWTVFDANPTDGESVVTGTIAASLIGYKIIVGFTDDTNITSAQNLTWYVGADIAIGGQSLSEDLSTDGAVPALPGYFYYNGTSSAPTSSGRAAYEIARAIIESEQVAVCITNTGVGSTALAAQSGDSDYWNKPDGALWSNTASRISSMTGGENRLEMFIFQQGSKDSITNVSTSEYLTALSEFFTRVRSVVTGPDGSALKIALAIIARSSSARTDQQNQNIRNAQIAFANTDSRVRLVNSFFIETEDGTHATDAAYTELGKQYVMAYYDLNGLPSASPLKVSSITSGDTANSFKLNFNANLLLSDSSYPTSSVGLFVDGVEQAVSSFTRTGDREATITAQDPLPSGEVSITIPYGIGEGQSTILMPRKANVSLSNIATPYNEFLEPFTSITAQLSQPPIANAGPNQSVEAGVLVQVSASASSDGDGTIVGYKWRETTNSGITLSSTTAENISFTSPVSDTAQTVTLELIVTDDDGVDSAPVYVDFNVAAEVVAPTLETLSIEIKGSGTGSHEVTVFLASDISTPIYSGLATFVNDRMVVESSDFSSGQQVVGLWLGNNYPATGGAFYGVVS